MSERSTPGPTGRAAAVVCLTATVVLLTACERAPAAAPYPDAAPPVTVAPGLTEYATPAETLFVRPMPAEASRLSLLFYRGQGVSRDADGRAYVPDSEGSRVLIVDRRLRAAGTVGGPDLEDGGLGQPTSVAATPRGAVFVVDREHPKGLVFFDERGAYVGAATPPVLNGDIRAAGDGALWAARSPYVLGFDPARAEDPLLYRFDPVAGEGIGIAYVEPVSDPRWNRLANAGAVAVGPDGTGYFGFLLRNEIRSYRESGDLVWRVRRSLPFDAPPPRFGAEAGSAGFEIRAVTQALAIGPDGRLYALTATDSLSGSSGLPAGSMRRLEVYDPGTGALTRATTVPGEWTTFAVDDDGRVYAVDPEVIDETAPPAERRALPDVALPTFNGDTARFTDYRGKALLINFWASWCAPCREEIPKLKEYYETLDSEHGEVLAISVDAAREQALEFIEPFDVPFPLFYGGEETGVAFGLRALPYTLLVDRRGRIVEEVYGFGSPRTWERLTTAFESEIERATPQPAAGSTAGAAHDHDAAEPR